MFCYHNQLLPPTFLDLFVTSSQVHSYDTRKASNYRLRACRTNLKQLTILYLGPKTGNSFPTRITGSSSFPTFKKRTYESFYWKNSDLFMPHIYAALFCIHCVFEVTSSYNPDVFLSSPHHIFIATFIFINVCFMANKSRESVDKILKCDRSNKILRYFPVVQQQQQLWKEMWCNILSLVSKWEWCVIQ